MSGFPREKRAIRTATNDRDRCGLVAPVHALDNFDLVPKPELQPLQRVQAQLIRRGPALLVFDAGLDGGPAMTKLLDELVHGTASLFVDNEEVGEQCR